LAKTCIDPIRLVHYGVPNQESCCSSRGPSLPDSRAADGAPHEASRRLSWRLCGEMPRLHF
jgi:hypothetical protein